MPTHDSKQDRAHTLLLSRWGHTTAGHDTISRTLRYQLDTLGPHSSFLIPDVPNDHWLSVIDGSSPDVVIIDFPDTLISPALSQVLCNLRRRAPICYLGMWPKEWYPAMEYDYIITVDEGAEADFRLFYRSQDWLPKPRFRHAVPLVNPAALQRPSDRELSAGADAIEAAPILAAARATRSEATLLWLESGSADERFNIMATMPEILAGNMAAVNVRVVASQHLPQPHPLRLAKPLGIEHILSATGYSACWELTALGLIDSAMLFDLDRVSENVHERPAQILKMAPADRHRLAARIRTASRCPDDDEESIRNVVRGILEEVS